MCIVQFIAINKIKNHDLLPQHQIKPVIEVGEYIQIKINNTMKEPFISSFMNDDHNLIISFKNSNCIYGRVTFKNLICIGILLYVLYTSYHHVLTHDYYLHLNLWCFCLFDVVWFWEQLTISL